jgi:hypothetical protein
MNRSMAGDTDDSESDGEFGATGLVTGPSIEGADCAEQGAGPAQRSIVIRMAIHRHEGRISIGNPNP